MDETAAPSALTGLLREAGSQLTAEEAEALLGGVAAAPQAADAETWLGLICPDPGPELLETLMARLAELRGADHGLAARRTVPDRLAALRAELKARELDGFIVPRADEHQGEYVAAGSERLAWLTGLTASAGLAVVLAETAAVFADGRYTLQAEAQVDGELFTRRHLTDEPATDWITDNLPNGGKLAYDPWLLTPGQVSRYEAACKKAGGELVAVDENPVDAVWTDRPPPPLAPVRHLETAYAGETAEDKCRRIAEALGETGADAAVLTAPDSVAWLLNVRGGDVPFTPFALSFAVLHADAGVDWFVDQRKLLPDLPANITNRVRIRPVDELGPALDSLGEAKKKVRMDPATQPAWVSMRLKAAGAAIDRGPDPCQLPKARKNAVQMDGMRAAHLRDGAAVTRFLAWLPEATAGGLTEMQAADHLEALRRENDLYRGLSFPTIAGSGPNGAIVHYRVTEETDRPLGDGELFLVDSGAQYLDGTTDITRTVAIGAPSADMRRHFTLVLKGHMALARARFPEGTTGNQLDVLARQALWAEGLDYDHGTGHGVGSFLSVHEGPHRITKTANRTELQPGMVVSNEPGYYRTDAYGIRIENLVAVSELERPAGAERDVFGFETLTLAPLDRSLIDTALLDAPEIAWIDAYHARVRDAITPLVDEAVGVWLAEATAPLD